MIWWPMEEAEAVPRCGAAFLFCWRKRLVSSCDTGDAQLESKGTILDRRLIMPNSRVETRPGRDRIIMSCSAFLRASASVLTGMALVGCQRCSQSNRALSPVELVYQDWRTSGYPAMAQQMLDLFHEEHPCIRVYYTPEPDEVAQSQTLADMQSGTAPVSHIRALSKQVVAGAVREN